MARLFGTDGVRGVANAELTCELAMRLGQAAVRFMGSPIVVGRDTRLSGDMLQAALVAGIASAGGDALIAGIVPTPAVALLVREMRAAGGIVISASHNPPEYNGIKCFDAQGFKLPDAVEDDIQAFVEAGGLDALDGDALPVGAGVGVAIELEDAAETYILHAVDSVASQGIDFSGLHVALDCGHGASSLTSAEALRRLGAEVTVVHDDFDGMDINVGCGSTCLDPLREVMAASGADVGIAHDGDADRVMLLSKDGVEIDGDIVEAVIARDMKMRGCLPHDTVVSTVMANLGFVRAMEDLGIAVKQTKVGDRYVLEEMLAGGFALGGEQSGHMILLDYNSTGDGLMTACQFLCAVRRSGRTVEDAIAIMKRFPQMLVNVRVRDKHALEGCVPVRDAVAAAEVRMGSDGRVLVRTSGTEPVVRVMVEASRAEIARSCAESIAAVVERELA
ncbi:phosphoglucosamine mutase [Slackia exigua]|uniref:Phosphoglucosamine mutase n=1 Tax=Slackia exigua (strain ATCC 700122 / DSM 15923 / CIP 105133 / JCM 11022 / KCTC 5966 / S-7) TaxID=649764 RepID=D0WJD8_SLAES|nr:phosphoglucosamine mutase [Slackia exigua]EEZ60486.1 phosphoglucosamine mutase [Slackia exigua ATCC 700122]STN99702.1 Phosphoglucosamine mutase [Slackia exigua]